MPAETIFTNRRYDLDWLRVIAFGLLIFYHVGMFYVPWDWHVKSTHASAFFEPWMRLMSPWRLPLLFFISGLALRFILDKTDNLKQFLLQRIWFLLVPLTFGILVVVPPQAWLELIESGETQSSFIGFYPEYVMGSIGKYSIQLPTWNHLWYVVYLLVYTVLLVPIAKPLTAFMNAKGAEVTHHLFARTYSIAWVLLVLSLPHIIYLVTLDPLFPKTHDVINDWANHAHSITFFITGYLLAKDIAFWSLFERLLRKAIITLVALTVALLVIWVNGKHLGYLAEPMYLLCRTFYTWAMLFVLLGLALKYLNKPSAKLTYLSKSIFPWYILHQTLIIVIGYWLTRQGLSLLEEFIALVIATFCGCWLLHEYVIRRFKLMHPLFGYK